MVTKDDITLNSLNGVIAYATPMIDRREVIGMRKALNSLNGVIAYATDNVKGSLHCLHPLMPLNSLNGVIAYATEGSVDDYTH